MDGPLVAPHLIMPSMRSKATMASSTKMVTNKSVWFNQGASVINKADLAFNASTRNLQEGWILTPSAWTTIAMEVYNMKMLNMVVEPLPIGFVATPIGVFPVWGFTHNHPLTPQDHTHDVTIPKGNYYNETDSWGSVRPPISHVPTVAPAMGDGPSPGPKSSGNCGGGGFFMGGSQKSGSMDYKKYFESRNQKYGMSRVGNSYKKNQGEDFKFNFDEYGELEPKPTFSKLEDC
jgi:hypothetical protein